MWKDSETELDFLDYDYLIKTVQSIITGIVRRNRLAGRI